MDPMGSMILHVLWNRAWFPWYLFVKTLRLRVYRPLFRLHWVLHRVAPHRRWRRATPFESADDTCGHGCSLRDLVFLLGSWWVKWPMITMWGPPLWCERWWTKAPVIIGHYRTISTINIHKPYSYWTYKPTNLDIILGASHCGNDDLFAHSYCEVLLRCLDGPISWLWSIQQVICVVCFLDHAFPFREYSNTYLCLVGNEGMIHNNYQ
jgi:hypothetical protein